MGDSVEVIAHAPRCRDISAVGLDAALSNGEMLAQQPKAQLCIDSVSQEQIADKTYNLGHGIHLFKLVSCKAKARE